MCIEHNGGIRVVRKGRFAVMNGREYELFSYQHQYYLKSDNPLDLQNGFREMNNNDAKYMKKINTEELDDAYEIFPYAFLEGYRFSVEDHRKKSGVVVLATYNPFAIKKVNVQRHGQHEYIFEIPYENIEIFEDRIGILGFTSL